ncbi:MAG: CoA-binding protein, partial [Anaerolineae bacterium]
MGNETMQDGLRKLFHGRSVAVVGASTDPGKLGHEILANIVEGGFQGRVYPVNPKASEVRGLTAYPSLS